MLRSFRGLPPAPGDEPEHDGDEQRAAIEEPEGPGADQPQGNEHEHDGPRAETRPARACKVLANVDAMSGNPFGLVSANGPAAGGSGSNNV